MTPSLWVFSGLVKAELHIRWLCCLSIRLGEFFQDNVISMTEPKIRAFVKVEWGNSFELEDKFGIAGWLLISYSQSAWLICSIVQCWCSYVSQLPSSIALFLVRTVVSVRASLSARKQQPITAAGVVTVASITQNVQLVLQPPVLDQTYNLWGQTFPVDVT